MYQFNAKAAGDFVFLGVGEFSQIIFFNKVNGMERYTKVGFLIYTEQI